MALTTIADEIERHLRTGDADMMGDPWPGDILERGRRQRADLRGALVEEVRRLAKGRTHEPLPGNVGVEFARGKVQPMVRGLSPRPSRTSCSRRSRSPSYTSRTRPSRSS